MPAPARRFSRLACAIALAAAAAGCGGAPELPGADFEAPATSVEYQVVLDGLPTDEMRGLAEESLTVYRYRDEGAFSVALLRRRAESDIETIQKILKSNGYYNGTVEVAVDEVDEAEFAATNEFEFPSLSDFKFWEKSDEPESPAPTTFARVVFTVDPGAQFTLARHDFVLADPAGGAVAPSPQALGSPVGGPAVAAPIVGAEAAAVEVMRARGYPYAESLGRDAVADLALATVEVESGLRSGPAAVYGPVTFEGLEDVEETYLRTYIPWEPGASVDREELREFQNDLLGTDLFDTLVVELPPDPPEAVGPVPLPVRVSADERPFRTVSVGGQYSTDEGPSVSVGFEHRNLWGSNETASVETEVGTRIQRLAFDYREPQYRRAGQDLVVALDLLHEEDSETLGFDQTSATLTGGIERELTEYWSVGAGGLLEASRISDAGVPDSDAFLAGIPTFAAYDDTDDLLNPTEGHRLRFDATPFAGTNDDAFTAFLTLDGRASAYWDILDNDDYVLAGRVRLASILTNTIDDVPKNRRLYVGGGGSLRGYAKGVVGPLDADNDPVGGLSALELAAELRARLWGDLGGALFVGAGSVSTESVPNFEAGMQYAAGFGLRYLTPAGPIRLDVAFPLNPRPVDDVFQLYVSIGQAF